MVSKSDSSLKLHVFDVGHGDSLVLEFPGRTSFAIIDCHRHDESHRGFGEDYDQSEPKALTYFRHLVAKGISPTVEFACLTHAHIDHYRGYGTLLKGLMDLGVPIKEFWDFGVAAKKARALMQLPDIAPFKERKDEMVRLLQVTDELIKQGMGRKILVNPTKAFWSKYGVEVDVLAPHANQFEVYANYLACQTAEERQQYRRHLKQRRCLTDENRGCKCSFDDNVVSSALLVKHGCCRLVLAGDITNCSWRGVLRRSETIDPRCDCIKVSHHGSVEGNFPNFKTDLWNLINRSKSRLVAVISGGYRHNLPHEKTLSSLKAAECDTYCTGAGKGTTLRPYVPPFYTRELVPFLLETVCFVEEHEQVSEYTRDFQGGHGNVLVECSMTGDCQISPEFSLPRRMLGAQIQMCLIFVVKAARRMWRRLLTLWRSR